MYVLTPGVITEGFQVPVIPLSDVVGRSSKMPPASHCRPIVAKTGMIRGCTTIVMVLLAAQIPLAGVKV